MFGLTTLGFSKMLGSWMLMIVSTIFITIIFILIVMIKNHYCYDYYDYSNYRHLILISR